MRLIVPLACKVTFTCKNKAVAHKCRHTRVHWALCEVFLSIDISQVGAVSDTFFNLTHFLVISRTAVMCVIFFLWQTCTYTLMHSFHTHTHMLKERKWGLGMREESKFKVIEEEHSSSVVQAQCFISRCRCVDYLFNWIFVWAWQRTVVVTVERRMIEQRKGRRWAGEGRWVSIISSACFWKHKPNYHRDRAKMCVRHMHAHQNTLAYARTHASAQTQAYVGSEHPLLLSEYTVGY